MNALHLVWPWPIDDPRHPSGGNGYDARLRDGLRQDGWICSEHVIPGAWPQAGDAPAQELERTLRGLRDGAPVLIDGVMAPAGAAAIAHAARRLRPVILLHMPFGEAFPELADAERQALAASAIVVTTSAWTRAWIRDRYGLPDGSVRVATPGVDAAPVSPPSDAGARLLCVANVSRLKGHDVLVDALAAIRSLAWRCTCVGASPAADGFVGALRERVRTAGLGGRIRWTGALHGAALEAAWADADVLVLASRRESYGMVLVEALAHGLPVVATRVGGVAEAVGRTAGGEAPGVLVEPESPAALAEALRRWLQNRALRARLRAAAAERRRELRGWPETVARVGGILVEVQRGVHPVA